MTQIVGDQFHQCGIVRSLQTRHEAPAAVGIHFRSGQPIEGRVFKGVDVVDRMPIGPLGELVARQVLRVESDGQIGLDPQLLALVWEVQPQLLTEIVQRIVGGLVVAQQCQPGLDFGQSRRLIVSLMPGGKQFANFVKLLGAQEMQRVVVVIILGAGDQLLQNRGSIRRERKILDEFNFPAPTH